MALAPLSLAKLEEAKQVLTLNLVKQGISTPPKIDAIIGMDVSGSFDDEHKDGLTNALMNRLIPWAMLFDPDQKMESYAFSAGVAKLEDVTLKNYANYIEKEVIGCSGYGRGTNYAPILSQVLEDFGWTGVGQSTTAEPAKTSFFGKMFGKTETPATTTVAGARRPSLVFFVTDGDNFDEAETNRVLSASQARGDKVFFQMIAVGNGSYFKYLNELASKYTNVAFQHIPDMNKWIALDDEALNNTIISNDLVNWIKA